MKDYWARIYANATVTKYNNGEGTIEEIVASYNLSEADSQQVINLAYSIKG